MLQRENNRFNVETVTSASEGLDELNNTDYDCIVSDYDMPGQSGLEFLNAVRADYSDLPFILYTGKGSEEVASDAVSAGVTEYLQKETGTSQYTILANRITNAVEKQYAQTKLNDREQRLKQTLKTVPACVVQLNTSGEFVFANDRAKEVLGVEPDNVTERKYNDPEWHIRDVDGSPIPDDELPFRQVCDTGDPLYDVRHMIEWPDGTQKILHVSGAPLFDDDGSVEKVIFALTDVTERVVHEKRIEALLENTTAPLFMKNRDGEYLLVNQGWEELFGHDDTEVLGRTDADLFLEEMAAEVQRNDRRVLETGEPIEEEETIVVNGQKRTYITSRSPVYDTGIESDPEDPVALFGVANEITEQKERERRLQRQNDRFDELASAVSHDLQTPLETARGRAELAVETGDTEQMEKTLDALKRTNELREDLVKVLRTKDIIGETEPVAIEQAGQLALETVSATEGISLKVRDALSVEADPNALRRLFENLFSNAIEHGNGEITVRIGRINSGFFVEDTGPGIPEDERDKVFTPGYSTKSGGSGVGLASVRQITLAHGWDICITESSAGGARFEVTNIEFAE